MYLTANLLQGLKIGTVLETISKTLSSISKNVVLSETISCVCGIVREVKSLLSVCICMCVYVLVHCTQYMYSETLSQTQLKIDL